MQCIIFEQAIRNDNHFAEAHFQVALLLMNEDAKATLNKKNAKSTPQRVKGKIKLLLLNW